MSLLSRLNDDMKTAMKAKDKESLQVIRMIKSSIQNEQIKEGHDLTEEEELTVLSREMKQRRDSLHEFEEAGRDDLAEKVKSEIVIVEKYMPEQLSDEEIRQLVQEAITQTGASSMKEFGKVMGAIMPKVKGKADGNQVNAIVKELLQSYFYHLNCGQSLSAVFLCS
ncbi:TPA: GatB/YqeY domain-containing protein [Enterococcus faecium]